MLGYCWELTPTGVLLIVSNILVKLMYLRFNAFPPEIWGEILAFTAPGHGSNSTTDDKTTRHVH